MSQSSDRRQSPRLSPDGLAFFKIEPDEGGTVADVSEGGVGFHLISPVTVSDARPIKFSFSFDSQNLIYGFGELAWLDETRKSGGLKFLRVPEEVIGKLRSSAGVFSLYPEYTPLETEMTATMRGPAEIEMGAVQTLVQDEPRQAVDDLPLPQPESTPSTSSVVMRPAAEADVEERTVVPSVFHAEGPSVVPSVVPLVMAPASSVVPSEMPCVISADTPEVVPSMNAAAPAMSETIAAPAEDQVASELGPMVEAFRREQEREEALQAAKREQAVVEEVKATEPANGTKASAGFAAGIKARRERLQDPAYEKSFSPLPSGPVNVKAPTAAVPVPATDFYGHPEKDPALVQMTSEELWNGSGKSGPAEFLGSSNFSGGSDGSSGPSGLRDPFGGSADNWRKEPKQPEFGRPVFTTPSKPMFSPGLIRGLIAALIIGTVVAGGALALISYREQAGGWLIHMGQRLSGRTPVAVSENPDEAPANANDADANEVKQPEASAQPAENAPAETAPAAAAVTATPKASEPAPVATSAPLSKPVTQPIPAATTKPVAATTASTTSPSNAKPAHVAGVANASLTPASTDNGEADVEAAERSLHGASGASDPNAAAQLFWVAVGKGNTTAEIALADLYMRGQGVPKSCDQARVLLSAAVSKGNSAASAKLMELNNGGCRP